MKRTSLIALSLLFTLACDGDKSTAPATVTPFVPTPTVTGMSLSAPIQTVPPGQAVQLTAVARYSDGATKDVTAQAFWTSSQLNVARVSAGIVSGVGLGRTTIRVVFERFSSSQTIVVQPGGTSILKGRVTEAGGVGVSGATVEVVGGPSNRVNTDTSGTYELFGVTLASIVRFGKDGYFDERREVTMSGDQALDVQITPRAAPFDVAGSYSVTFTLTASCGGFPPSLKTRTYTARIDQDAARLVVTLGDASFGIGKNTIPGRITGNAATFNIGNGSSSFYYYYYYDFLTSVQELLANGQAILMFGTINATAAPQTISGTLSGGFVFRNGNQHITCVGSGNPVVFTRR